LQPNGPESLHVFRTSLQLDATSNASCQRLAVLISSYGAEVSASACIICNGIPVVSATRMRLCDRSGASSASRTSKSGNPPAQTPRYRDIAHKDPSIDFDHSRTKTMWPKRLACNWGTPVLHTRGALMLGSRVFGRRVSRAAFSVDVIHRSRRPKDLIKVGAQLGGNDRQSLSAAW
jgi:hypothetical protein